MVEYLNPLKTLLCLWYYKKCIQTSASELLKIWRNVSSSPKNWLYGIYKFSSPNGSWLLFVVNESIKNDKIADSMTITYMQRTKAIILLSSHGK